ncbi:TPA: type II toxin-antitoxin system RelE/ParE family toxin [Legionella pneumophila]|nr:type II toxin-antitoxin system RelE/ParE family toxin [Legionella pneumophila]HAU0352117.1 type II toxin-antitoxin system RelE/ParE family toxin [Legionella pneumophila]HAU0355293.1 type II toxin-antitoxin system RelE/ParE family toxin [Legionella pneumophila]HAU0361462.1 type II toxin-antitoxin system RelE/ParE family toxin [Legionella pneumophila]HAU0370237.1 type II toxin-antitoxin system RelE/ParE family toxin [Legionella pneumophila]
MNDSLKTRVFKSAWFHRAAKKARITDQELCDAIAQVMLGQADDLGGGVYKKRLNENQHRSIVLAKGGRFWIFEYLYAKKDRSNIDSQELADFRTLAKAYAGLSDAQLARLIRDKDLWEICHDC